MRAAPRSALLVLALAVHAAGAAEIRVAVASNFAEPARAIIEQFEANSGHRVTLILGSTGKHYAQIRNGAPLDALLAADAARPDRLERERLAVPGSRFTYAVGRLVLWSPDPDGVDEHGRVLKHGTFRHLAIANPRLAPYGAAARQVLEALRLWDSLGDRMVRGENIAQTFQFVASGNAELGFVAWSQVIGYPPAAAGSWWQVPQMLHDPIEQQAVLLRDTRAGREFLAFMKHDRVRKIIRDFGYDLP